MAVFGIDISEFQKGMDLKRAKDEGVRFAIIRAGYTGYAAGKAQAKDSAFEEHYRNAKSNGLGVGAYFFSRATSYAEGRKEGQFMYENCLKGKVFEYPIYIDVEDSYYQQKAGKKAVTEGIKGFLEYVRSKGYYVGVYANVNWFKNYIDTNALTRYDKWVASWGKERPSFPVGGMWQFGGSTNEIRSNKVAGIVCDQDYAYKDYPAIIKEKGLNGLGKGEDKPTPPKGDIIYTVVSGDTLSGIAEKYGTTYQELARINGIEDPNLIRVGEKIRIPSSNVGGGTKYVVKRGDNLSTIALKYHTSWQKIYNDNKKVIGSNPNLIKVGQVLVIK